jgi:LuxR family maltose regulon positive regulatory protein
MAALLAAFLRAQRRGEQADRAVVSEAYVGRLLAALEPEPATGPSPLVEPLTEREREVLALMAAGLSNRQIADELVVALGTVKAHLHNIFGKLGVQSRTEAAARAREMELL